jgi:hypothetical protein
MKPFRYIVLLTALSLPACGDSETPNGDQSADPLQEVPDADAAAAEADAINADNAADELSELQKEMDADQ